MCHSTTHHLCSVRSPPRVEPPSIRSRLSWPLGRIADQPSLWNRPLTRLSDSAVPVLPLTHRPFLLHLLCYISLLSQTLKCSLGPASVLGYCPSPPGDLVRLRTLNTTHLPTAPRLCPRLRRSCSPASCPWPPPGRAIGPGMPLPPNRSKL